MKKIELLAPAKDLFKAKIAILYGADAVYVGGTSFSLRSRASNFTLEDLKELSSFAKARGAKVYVTVNIVFHNSDLVGLREYLLTLEAIGIDAIIVSSLSVASLSKQIAPNMEVHISTQLSVLNSSACKTLSLWGADRVVLAREASMEDIAAIARKSDLPLEVFIHGGMCSNYSGRCVLSNRMSGRDANRGGCAHCCRWRYHVFENNIRISDDQTLLTMSSKDLRASAYVEDMIYAGVASLKIEGRMKSEYYIAQVVRTYRKMIDEIYEKGSLTKEALEYYDSELAKAENRPADDGFLSGKCGSDKHLYEETDHVTHEYAAYVRNYDPKRSLALIEVKNRFSEGDELEVISPKETRTFKAVLLFDENWKEVTYANKAMQLLYMRVPFEVHNGDMMRKASHDR